MRLMQIVVPLVIAAGVIVPVIRASIFSLEEHERLVVFRLGKPVAVRGPGSVILWPIVERGSRFDIRDEFNAKLVADYEAQLALKKHD